MNCTEVQQQLSAYFDGELPVEMETQIASHLEGCSACARELASFDRLSKLSGQLTDPPVPDGMWEQWESARDRQQEPRAQPLLPTGRSSQFSRRILVIAVGLLIALGLSFFGYREWFAPDEHDHLAVNFEHYLEQFDNNPDQAQQILMAKYDGRPTTIEKAAEVLKYDPVIAKGLPTGCSLENVYLLDMPCCQCAQAVCKCDDDQHIAVFEHNLDQPVWFGDRPTLKCLCHGKETSVVQVNDRLAATWKQENRFITIIGARDLAEVTRFVAHFTGTKTNG
ncbi:MAG: zf-HC2 domain-containing protein [Planctomycetaceae bacterium]|nr:zf-HC2 domain-containing protein [Planctomycetaceae bacterium]